MKMQSAWTFKSLEISRRFLTFFMRPIISSLRFIQRTLRTTKFELVSEEPSAAQSGTTALDKARS